MNYKFLIILLVCAICASPASSISRWFSATYNDLKFTLYRYGVCVNGLSPLSSSRLNETEFLINQIRVFLDQGNYDNEQLANLTGLMDTVCRSGSDLNYPISVHIDVHRFSNNNTRGKENRCRAIDDAMDSMYYVFKRAAINHSEPLDFSSIQFNVTESGSYNLSDLINTSWISSEVVLEQVCTITNATKEYVAARTSKAAAQSRQQLPPGYVSSLLAFIDRMVEPLLGLQKRLYWEGTTRLELMQTRISSGLSSIRRGVVGGLDSTRDLLFGARNSTSSAKPNPAFNSTRVRFNGTSPAMVSGKSDVAPSPTVASLDLNATATAASGTTSSSLVLGGSSTVAPSARANP